MNEETLKRAINVALTLHQGGLSHGACRAATMVALKSSPEDEDELLRRATAAADEFDQKPEPKAEQKPGRSDDDYRSAVYRTGEYHSL